LSAARRLFLVVVRHVVPIVVVVSASKAASCKCFAPKVVVVVVAVVVRVFGLFRSSSSASRHEFRSHGGHEKDGSATFDNRQRHRSPDQNGGSILVGSGKIVTLFAGKVLILVASSFCASGKLEQL
jgi:hypothetical protein